MCKPKLLKLGVCKPKLLKLGVCKPKLLKLGVCAHFCTFFKAFETVGVCSFLSSFFSFLLLSNVVCYVIQLLMNGSLG